MKLIDCQPEKHSGEILEILNDAIEHSTALYDYRPRPPESMVTWFHAKDAGGFPVIGMTDEDEQLIGFATYGTFRAWPAYKYSVESSVYVHKGHRGKGVGLALMKKLIEVATARQLHVL